MDNKTIADFVKEQETAYKQPIRLNETWNWSMHDHIQRSFAYKHSQLRDSTKTTTTPIKNITRPILNLQYRAEGFDVKDITLFVDDEKNYFKSFLVKKFHEKWAREHGIDTVIDAMVESYIDFGGALLKNVNDVKPEVVPLQSIAFCDQTDMLSGPIGIKHFFSPDQLLEMEKRGWGEKRNGATASLEDAIELSKEEKKDQSYSNANKTPGKYIEIYEIHGNLPKKFLKETTSKEYVNQFHIGCFYQRKDSSDKGWITLYRAEEIKSPFKLVLRDHIYGRALGFGGAEELFDDQIWANNDEIRMNQMLDAASKTILKFVGNGPSSFRGKIRDLENLEIVDPGPGNDIAVLDTFPRNKALFEQDQNAKQLHAQQMGGATDALLGVAPSSGTPFKLQDLVTQQGQGLHDYRKGKLATFWDELERDWIVPHLAREIVKEQEFIAELDLDELQYVAESLVQCETEKMKMTYVLQNLGQAPLPEQIEEYKKAVQEQFRKKGNKHFIKILKGEMKGAPLDVRTNIVGKQKDLAGKVDKLVNMLRFLMSTYDPNTQTFSALQNKGVAKIVNQIVEDSGLDPVDFADFSKPPQQMPQPQNPQQPQPLAAPQMQNAY